MASSCLNDLRIVSSLISGSILTTGFDVSFTGGGVTFAVDFLVVLFFFVVEELLFVLVLLGAACEYTASPTKASATTNKHNLTIRLFILNLLLFQVKHHRRKFSSSSIGSYHVNLIQE